MTPTAGSSRSGRPGGRLAPASDGLVVSWGGAGGSSPRVQVAEIQRSRLLAAAVAAVEEHGYSDTTVSHITARARISRRTFYELFDNCEDCLVTVLEDALGRISHEIADVMVGASSWRERVKAGLWAILSFFDREPALARVCVVQALRGSETVLERRAEVFAGLARAIDQGRGESARGGDVPALTAEGLVGAANAIVYARLLKPEGEPLTNLMGDLMGMIALPYLGSAVAKREQTRHIPVSAACSGKKARNESSRNADSDPLEGLHMRLTYRTARVLDCIAEQPGISNRMVGERAGITDQGQTSKLLSRLERLGLAVNKGEGHTKGEPNSWQLTPTGQHVAQSINTHSQPHTEAA